MRLFVAVDVPETLKGEMESRTVDPLRGELAHARWTRPESRHLTLKFLGNVDDDRVADIGVSLRAAATGHRPFSVRFSEVGGFPTLRRPRVLWVGVGQGAEPLRALAEDVEGGLSELGFEPEGRPFRGHLTLARFARPRIIEQFPSVRVPSDRFEVADIVLFESRLHPKGARYTAVERFPLSAE